MLSTSPTRGGHKIVGSQSITPHTWGALFTFPITETSTLHQGTSSKMLIAKNCS